MKKRFNINITESAKKDILEIIDYYRKTINDLEAAKKFIYKIKDKFSLIAVYPKCYPLIKNEHVKDKNIRKVVLDNYIIFYIIDGKNKTIMILRILNGFTDYYRIL